MCRSKLNVYSYGWWQTLFVKETRSAPCSTRNRITSCLYKDPTRHAYAQCLYRLGPGILVSSFKALSPSTSDNLLQSSNPSTYTAIQQWNPIHASKVKHPEEVDDLLPNGC
ncbi:uncharacterized protein LOC135198163 isoform X3 [Macrobrachium nipponense]|uniref:uncharacterized protein LOC135198163 isoform X3 n=1 Tax=Macrobrachium nipponense TaxID=159736 RepID=UPI0030C7FD7C